MNIILKKIDIISNTLSKVSILSWLLFYVLLIFIFALLYMIPRAAFFHTTSQQELSYHKQATYLSKQLQKYIRDNISSVYKHHTIKDGNWLINKDQIKVNKIRVNEGALIISIGCYATYLLSEKHEKNETSYLQFFTQFDVIIQAGIIKIGDDIFYPVELKHSKGPFSSNPKIESINLIKIFKLSELQASGIKVSTEFNDEKIFFMAASQGFPSKLNNHFARMLYLSAVTITTLGYGDIVPITGLARFLVGLEATLGILVLGLMLNSTNKKTKGKSSD